MNATPVQDWPHATAPEFHGASRDGTDVYELFDHPTDDSSLQVAIYHRQSNGLWPCRSVCYADPARDSAANEGLRAHFLSVTGAWLERAASVVDHRADQSIALPPCKAQDDTLSSRAPEFPRAGIPVRRRHKGGKMREITKAESNAFNAAFAAVMANYPSTPDGYSWIAQTDFGPLLVHKPHEQSLYYCIYTAFNGHVHQIKLAAQRFDSNPFSGKWNILEHEGDSAIDVLRIRFQTVNAHP